MKRRSTLLLLGVLLTILGACERDAEESPTTAPAAGEGVTFEDVKDSAREAAETTGAFLRQMRERYQREVQDELERLDERMEELKKRLNDAAGQARPELERRMEELKRKGQEVRERLDKLGEASGDAVERVREGLDEAIGELREALDEGGAAAPPPTQPAPEAGPVRP